MAGYIRSPEFLQYFIYIYAVSTMFKALADSPFRIMDRGLTSLINLFYCIHGFQLSKQTKGITNLTIKVSLTILGKFSHLKSISHLAVKIPGTSQRRMIPLSYLPRPFLSTVVDH